MRARAELSRSTKALLSSWLFLGIVLTGLVGLAGVAVVEIQSRGHQQAVTAAVEDARVISRLTVERNLRAGDARRHLTTAQRKDLNADVAQLRLGRDLLELVVRRPDGTVIYQRGELATRTVAGTRRRPSVRSPQVRFLDAPTAAGVVRAVTVGLAIKRARGADALVVDITIPARDVESQTGWASRVLIVATLVGMIVATAGVVSMRRRLRLRTYQASHDSLTRLGNRLLLQSAVSMMNGRARPFALMVMDLDGFKRVNDSLGHAAGDELLISIAQALRGGIRPDDVLVRLGGDEFAVVMPGLTRPHAQAAATRLLDTVRTQFVTRGVAIDCDASIGVALAPDDGTNFGELLRAADIAMYDAKRGKLGVQMFDGSGAGHRDDLQTLLDLRDGISRDELELHYQPAVGIGPTADASTTCHLEALVRWRHPTRGLLYPDAFIGLAEDTALIHPLTTWVLDEAVRQCAQWRLDGLDTRVAINISPRSLAYPGLVATVVDTLARHQLPAEGIQLEITESAVITQPEHARDVLTDLHERGISIAIDDFGTGYTSLALLKTLSVDTLKVDRCFVSDLLVERQDETIVAAIIDLGHGLDMDVIAEGVEDALTLNRLTELGCDLAQGYYFSRPMPAASATSWLRAYDVEVRALTTSPARAV